MTHNKFSMINSQSKPAPFRDQHAGVSFPRFPVSAPDHLAGVLVEGAGPPETGATVFVLELAGGVPIGGSQPHFLVMR